jgi:hypothetical protein
MDVVYLIPLLLLGAAGSIQYVLGSKKNRWLGKRLSIQAEDVLQPKSTEYINIGGVIGYNFVYKLRDPWREAKGSFTFVPRHSMLYVPISYLIGNRDRFFMNLFADKRLAGEGHIVERGHLRRAKIEGIESMRRQEVTKRGARFVLLFRDDRMGEALGRTLDGFPDPTILSHFCCYDDNKTFFLYLKPKKGAIEEALRVFLRVCPEYFR